MLFSNYDDLKRTLDAHGSHTAAVLLEPIQGEAGLVSLSSLSLSCTHQV